MCSQPEFYPNEIYTPFYTTTDVKQPNPVPASVATNRTVYINRNFTANTLNMKVLINPNFKHSVHINPNFNNVDQFKNSNVYVNPSIFKPKPTVEVPPLNSVPIKLSRFSKVNKVSSSNTNYAEINRFSKINKVTQSTVSNTRCDIGRFSKINKIQAISTNTNLINNNGRFTKINKPSAPTHDNTQCNSKYKFIRSSGSAVKRRSGGSLNKFKLDKRNTSTAISTPKRLSMKAYLMKLDPQKSIFKKAINVSVNRTLRRTSNKFKLDNRNKTRLNTKAILMTLDPQRQIIKKSPNKIILSPSKIKSRIIKVKGQMYRYCDNSSNRQSGRFKYSKDKKIVVGGLTYVMINSTSSNLYANNRVKINKKVLKKDNLPCVKYIKKGYCIGHFEGTCIKRHDPNQINICIRFLQGACHNKECLLSHNVSPEKMPTCKYFLEGRCHNEACQYVHVKLSSNTEICKEFLRGFCKSGLQCMKRHQFLCPDFEQTSKCSKKICPYPHGDTVRQYKDKILNKIARSTFKKTVTGKSSKVKNDAKKPIAEPHALRYYEGEGCGKSDGLDVDGEKNLLNRPKLGALPSFIPLGK